VSAHAAKTKDEIAAAYSSPPWWYDLRGFFILTFAYNSTLTHQLRFFGPNFGSRHLEVACGTGTLLDMVLRWRAWKRLPATHVIGVDYAESMLAGAIRRFAGRADVQVRHADAAAIPFPDGSFDTANIANAIHCFPDVAGALSDVFRVLKPGGTLAANVLLYPRGMWPFRQIAERIDVWGIKKGILYTPYRQDEMRQHIVAAGFELDSERLSGNCYDVLARKPVAENLP
jgi:ubiquinone/menaquinone biosynthesis C-methylase UbiE